MSEPVMPATPEMPAADAPPPAAPQNPAAPPSADSQPPANPATPQTPASPSFYMPKDFPDHLKGKDQNETLDKAFAAWSGARKIIGDKPQNADGYELTVSEALKPYEAELKDNAFLKDMKGYAFENGMSKTQFNGFLNKSIERLQKEGTLAAPYNIDAEIKIIAPDAPDNQRKGQAEKVISDNKAYLDGMVAQKEVSKETADYIKSNLNMGHMNNLLLAMRGMNKGDNVMVGGAVHNGISEAEMGAIIKDPRYNSSSPQYDKDWRAEQDKKMQEAFAKKSA
jgi:hypothetical protein